MPLGTLPTQSETQAKFDAASEAAVSPCMWIPPEWAQLQLRSGKQALPDNSLDSDLFDYPGHDADARKRIKYGRDMNAPDDPQDDPNDDTWPNPFANFEHTDDEEFSARSLELVKKQIDPGADGQQMYDAASAVANVFEQNRQAIITALKDPKMFRKAVAVLQAKAFAKPGELKKVADLVDATGDVNTAVLAAVGGDKKMYQGIISVLQASPGTTLPSGYDLLNARDTVAHLQGIVGPDSPGMKRLALVFEWILWRTTVLMNDLNLALKAGNETRYTEARDNYIKFVRDLDDHQPGKSTDPIDVTDKKARSGYGGAVKWNCIDPVIYQGRIWGVRAVVKWNPHSSSNGIPLPDP